MNTSNLSNNNSLNTYDRIINESDHSTDQDASDFKLDVSDYSHVNCMQITEQNPSKWSKQDIRLWLTQKDLEHLITLQPLRECANGKQLLKLNPTDFQHNDAIERLFREITKLQLAAKKYKHDTQMTQLTEYDIFEMKRRITVFTNKWDKILWIQNYHHMNNKIPTKKTIALELGLSLVLSSMYLEYYNEMDRYLKNDLNQVFSNFNVHRDCMLWWYLLVTYLKKDSSSQAICLILSRVCLIAPHKISIQLLDKYQTDLLSHFDTNQLNKITQQIVIGSRYTICTALRVAKWYQNVAKQNNLDIAKEQLFERIVEAHIQSALNYLKLVESDHLRTILLETKSDLDNMSALDMANEFELISFVQDEIIQRICTSIMYHWEFLKPINHEESFKIEMFSIDLIWDKLWNTSSTFFLIPVGSYVTQIVLYLVFLMLFTFLSFSKLHLYGNMENTEIVFWFINISFIVNEIQAIGIQGFKHFNSIESYFDKPITISLLLMWGIRIYYINHTLDCMEYETDCWRLRPENVVFIALWCITTILLYIRLMRFCILNNTLSPIVHMLKSILSNIISFLKISVFIFIGYFLSLLFIIYSIGKDIDDQSLIEAMNDLSDYSFLYIVIIVYLVLSAIILLTTFTNYMRFTFDDIHKQNISEIRFSRFALSMQLDKNKTSFIPVPLNIIIMIVIILFYAIEMPINWIKMLYFYIRYTKECNTRFVVFDLSLCMIPSCIRKTTLELDQQICYLNCGRVWHMDTNKGKTSCAMVDFNDAAMKHTIKFFRTENENRKSQRVSIRPHIQKQATWNLNIMELHDKGLIDLQQFVIEIDSKCITEAHKSMQTVFWWCSGGKTKHSNTKSSYFICAYCRNYVQASKFSIIRLSKELNINDIEMASVYKQMKTPMLCPHCFRVKTEINRVQLIGEILSYWICRCFIWWILIIIFALLKFIKNPQIITANFKCCNKPKTKTYFCSNYYDEKLIENMYAENVTDTLFDRHTDDNVWNTLNETQNGIDPLALKNTMKQNIMNKNIDEELTQLQFITDFVGMNMFKSIYTDETWNNYFQPLAVSIFNKITTKAAQQIPLHLVMKYPLNAAMCLDLLDQFW
eukprot:375836_1